MLFYLGTHIVGHAKHIKRCFISVKRLEGRKADFEVDNWIMDSGAFTEISTYGEYRFPVLRYAEQINRWATCGYLETAVCQDYMCEPFILQKTRMGIKEHQILTIKRYDELLPLTKVPILPVLQGYFPREYCEHIELYGDRLLKNMRVGVGSICKRNTKPLEVVRVLEAIKTKRPDLRLHGFGLKITALANLYLLSLLYSADSMAWSYKARRDKRNANGLKEALEFVAEIQKIQGTKPHQFQLC